MPATNRNAPFPNDQGYPVPQVGLPAHDEAFESGDVFGDEGDMSEAEVIIPSPELGPFEVLAAKLPVPLVWMRPDGTVTYTNLEAARATGYAVEEMLGRTFWLEVTHPEDRHRLTQALRDAARQGQAETSVRFQTKDGAMRRVDVYLQPVGDGDEVGGALFDVTEQDEVAAALHRLAAWPGVSKLRASRLYRSPPWGLQAQPDFINAVARFDYCGTAVDLLTGLLAIEREAGRVRGGERWGPRLLDLDLLDYGGQRIELPGLSLPHPRIAERAFVLLPLCELSPDLRLPGLGPVLASVADLAAQVDRQGVAALD